MQYPWKFSYHPFRSHAKLFLFHATHSSTTRSLFSLPYTQSRKQLIHPRADSIEEAITTRRRIPEVIHLMTRLPKRQDHSKIILILPTVCYIDFHDLDASKYFVIYLWDIFLVMGHTKPIPRPMWIVILLICSISLFFF